MLASGIPMRKNVFEKSCADLKDSFEESMTVSERKFKMCMETFINQGSTGNGILLGMLVNYIENEVIKMVDDNMKAQKKKCVKTYDNIFYQFQKSVMDEKTSNIDGSKIYAKELTIMESGAQNHDTTFIDEFVWQEVESSYNDIVVGGIVLYIYTPYVK